MCSQFRHTRGCNVLAIKTDKESRNEPIGALKSNLHERIGREILGHDVALAIPAHKLHVITVQLKWSKLMQPRKKGNRY
jgi:hypothetical protein